MEQKYLSTKMKTKQLFVNFGFRTATILGIVIIIFMLIFTILQLSLGCQLALEKAKVLQSSAQNISVQPEEWEHEIQKSMWKEKFWIENQLFISGIDSMSLGINLADSVIHLYFKGLSLISAEIQSVYPDNFLHNLSGKEYAFLFGHPLMVIQSKSNIEKRQFKKIKVNKAGDRQVLDSTEVNPESFIWQFTLDNNINFVVSGLPSDTLSSQYPYFLDVIKNRFSKLGMSLFRPYEPTIYIWVSGKEAQTIYQALPNNPHVIIRN